MKTTFGICALVIFAIVSCDKNEPENYVPATYNYPAVSAAFGNKLDLNHLQNYANQAVPAYITRDNTGANPISDKGATLGRVLFYDKNLSSDNSVSCSMCHIQANAFGDSRLTSTGVNGQSARHSMRLINARYANEQKFFWDERAPTLEFQTTQPIQNHAEMGYSGANGDLSIADLVAKLQAIAYYRELFDFAYGDSEVTETRIQDALAQFVRSIVSFDSKYDLSRITGPDDNPPFPNFTMQENDGKHLFNTPPVFDVHGTRTGGGVGCAICHASPEFDIDPNSRNNGVTGSIGNPGMLEINNTRAPSLRDIMTADGTLNGPLMHTGEFNTIEDVLNHYNTITVVQGNTNLDSRLRPAGIPQKLNMTAAEVTAIKAFLKTLGGTNVYTAAKWSTPF